MAKITEAQRKYFVSRVSGKMNNVIAGLKQQNAAEVTKDAEESLENYLKAIKVFDDLATLEKLQTDRDAVANRLESTAKQIEDVLKEAGHIGQYETIHYWKDSAHETWVKTFQKFCNITCSKEAKSGIAKDIAKLESKRDEAVDFLYGLSNESELANGVAKILTGTGVKLIG